MYRFHRDMLGLKPQFEAEHGPYAELVARGVGFGRAPASMGDRIRGAYLADPEGDVVGLQEWLALRG